MYKNFKSIRKSVEKIFPRKKFELSVSSRIFSQAHYVYKNTQRYTYADIFTIRMLMKV